MNYYCGKFASSTDCFTLSSKDGYSMKFLYLYLLSKLDVLQFGFRGVGLQHLSKDYLNDILIPMLTRNQQDEILEMLVDINAAIENADKSMKKAKLLMMKILKEYLKEGD